MHDLTRRRLLQLSLTIPAGVAIGGCLRDKAEAQAGRETSKPAGPSTGASAEPSGPTESPAPQARPSAQEGATMNTRPIPKSGEALPVIGLGTWQTFDIASTGDERGPVREVVQRLLAAGGRVIDSSPMYGRAETVTGDVLADLGAIGKPFLATKVWTRGGPEGIAQMERSFQRMRTQRMDLLQIHNLLDWKTHLPTLRAWKEAGRIRYIGITHYAHSAFEEMEQILRTEALDFVQLPYNLEDREVEKRLLPAARDAGTAVLVMRPFAEGSLFQRVRGKALPAWAADFDCTSWAQFFLKFILGHPAVTCPIPATAKPDHVADNLKAGLGRLPDENTRRKMIALLG
ncbi:aldo/keto reductase [Chondromyces crocatus]|uniref:Aldo/keto reductase n=1 Tax=Chondromyces crocatus TaxID=52 RepID=A0A0K1ENQ7_CHOCO|nr:aldo/keto reductase [Chondromyces crocatus]AKT42486.1 aldo/keto reductase [Chondromyces crocatus]